MSKPKTPPPFPKTIYVKMEEDYLVSGEDKALLADHEIGRIGTYKLVKVEDVVLVAKIVEK